jgi:hypothetical protein
MNTNSKLTTKDRAKEATISSFEEFRQYIRENSIGDRALSARGLAGLCGVHHSVVFKGGGFYSTKLAQKLTSLGFEHGGLLEKGFDSNASWAVVEYYAFESKANAPGAKKLARLFGALGVAKAFEIAEEPKMEKVTRKSFDDLSKTQLWALWLRQELLRYGRNPDPKMLDGIDPAFWGAPREVVRYAFRRRDLAEIEWLQPSYDEQLDCWGDRGTMVKNMRRRLNYLQDYRKHVEALEIDGAAKMLQDFEVAINGALVA